LEGKHTELFNSLAAKNPKARNPSNASKIIPIDATHIVWINR